MLSISHKAIVYRVFTTPPHLHLLTLFRLLSHFFFCSLCHSVSCLTNNGVVVIPGSLCATSVSGKSSLFLIIVSVTAISSPRMALHIQVGNFISTHLDLFVIGCLHFHSSATQTDAEEINAPRFRLRRKKRLYSESSYDFLLYKPIKYKTGKELCPLVSHFYRHQTPRRFGYVWKNLQQSCWQFAAVANDD